MGLPLGVAVPAALGLGYGITRNIAVPALQGRGLMKEGNSLKERLRNNLPYYAAAAAGTGLLAGIGGYGYGKYRHGMSGYVPTEDSAVRNAGNILASMRGRTGLEKAGLPGMLDSARKRFVDAAGQAGIDISTPGGAVRVPSVTADMLSGKADRVRGRDVIQPAGMTGIKNAFADNLTRILLRLTVDKASAACKLRLGSGSDKLSADIRTAAASKWLKSIKPVGIGLGIGGAGYLGTDLYRRNVIDPALSEGRRKYRMGRVIEDLAYPAAMLAGGAIGGTAGYLAGRESGRRQRDAAFDDIMEMHAMDTAAGQLMNG